MPVLRLFAAAREVAGVAREDIDGATVAEMLDRARARHGERFAAVLARSRIWVNGEPASEDTVVGGHDVVAVLPPVSGGAGEVAVAEPPLPRPPLPSGDGAARLSASRRPPMAALGGLDGPSSPPAPAGAVRLGRPAVVGAPAPASRAAPAPASGPATAVAAPPRPPAAPPAPAPPAAPPPPGLVPYPPAAPAAPAGQGIAAWARRNFERLAVVPGSSRPHGRIGLVWAAVTVAAAVGGQPWLAGWLGAAAFIGGSQTAAARRAVDQRPPPWVAAVMAVGPPVAAVFGAGPLAAVAGAGLGLALLAQALSDRPASHDLGLAVLIGTAVGLAAAGPVLVRGLGVDPTLFLLAATATYDAGAYLVGTGAAALWEGPLAGVVALIPVTILAAVLLVPPFPVGSPLLMGALAAVLAPLGPLAGTALLGGREVDAPALRRLDSLLLLGPVWAGVATLVLR